MARIANTAFEVSVSNSTRNETQNVPGYFGAGVGAEFVGDICPSGFLVVRSELTQSEGYAAGTLNGNTWRFIAAATGAVTGRPGDHTGIYAFNPYNIQQMTDQRGNVYMVGANTLGLELPAGQRGDFTELIVGEQYAWGAGNFSTIPTDGTYIYATIVNGLLVAATAAPTDGSVYLRIWRQKNFTIGTRNAPFGGYVCEVLRSVDAGQ